MECTPPSLDIAFDFKAGLDAQAKAEFMADIELFRVKMMAIAQGMFKLRALVDAEYAAELGIESPVAVIQGQLTAMLSVLLPAPSPLRWLTQTLQWLSCVSTTASVRYARSSRR